MKNLRTYDLAVSFYKQCNQLKLPYFLKDQLRRASSSVVLNLAEGSPKPHKDRRRFYTIALASHREVQAILDITEAPTKLTAAADHLGASLYKLVKALE